MNPHSGEALLTALLSEDLASVRAREDSALDDILNQFGKRCVLFGAGSLGRSVLGCFRQDSIRPLAFSDNNPALWNTDLDGIPVLSPANAASRYGSEAAFFVSIWTTGHRYADTHARLASLGCRHVYPVASVRWKYSTELLPFYCQDMPHKVFQEADCVKAAFGLWADERSREEYLAQVRYRACGDYQGLSAPDPEPSYFLDSLFSLHSDEVFIDCGAFNGDTIREVIGRCGDAFSRIVALEPDPDNFAEIEKYLASLPAEMAARIRALPYAAARTNGKVRFRADSSLLSALSDSGNISVEAVALDGLIQEPPPTFIKMDIEGAEVEALAGARELISKYRPILAICLYHRQSDLWHIPLLIHSMYPGYHHFLRSYEEDGWQTVGYAIPPERLHGLYGSSHAENPGH